MAIAFARMEFVKRSAGKNVVCKAAYIDRCKLEFEGTNFQSPQTYSWAELEKPVFRNIYLPIHVDPSYKDAKTLWNAVEKFEKRKDSQVGLEIVLALPDDKSISIEDKICLIERFIEMHITSKGYAAHAVIHPPDKKHGRFSEISGLLEKADHNWHCHILITPRTFSEDGKTFNSKKLDHLFPTLRGATHFAFNGINWGKIWAQIQNDYFEEKGLNLRVDPPGIIPQEHNGPDRMRGKKIYAQLARGEEITLMNQELCKDPSLVLKMLTSTQSIFTFEDVENYFRKHAPETDINQLRDAFWKCQEIVELFPSQNLQPSHLPQTSQNSPPSNTKKFSTHNIVEEEKKIMRLAGRIQERPALPTSSFTDPEPFKKQLNEEQQRAFDTVISKSSLTCIEGHAGTGKSYLLVALKNFYESEGYTVRAFGPDNASAKVLNEKGFVNASNIYKGLFENHYSHEGVFSRKEIWFVDESGKVDNEALSELLKHAEKNRIQVVFVGNSAQLPSVARGGMFKKFCDTYGCVFLRDVQRQKAEHQRNISKNLATGNFKEAINMIASSGGFQWSDTKEDSILNLVEKWVKDKTHFPFGSQLIIAHSNMEVRHLNEIVHCYRKSWGELGPKEFTCQTSRGKITVSTGDIIEFRQKDTDLKVDNGSVGILVSASEDKFVVRIQDGVKDGEKTREVAFDPKKYTAFQLGYATTYFRSQGRTVDRAYVLYSQSMNKPMFYVGLTRHVRNAQCFVSREDASSLADIKRQVIRQYRKESSLNYTTLSEMEQQKQALEKEAKIESLSNSEHLLDRMKGGYLKTWGNLKSHIFGYIEKIQDRRDSKSFYNPIISINTLPGHVIEIAQAEQTTDVNLISKVEIDESGESGPQPSKPSPESQAHAPEQTPIPTPSEAMPIKNKHYQTVPENQKIFIRKYFEKVDEASALSSIVKSEIAGTNTHEQHAPTYQKWQIACGERNMAAHTLSLSVPPDTLKDVFGKLPLEILMDRADRHTKTLSPKIDLIHQLKENLEHLLHHLFPDGPTGRDAKGFRFGAKGAFSVVCKGDKLGCFFDFENKTGGDILKLIQTRLFLNESDTKEWAYKFLNHPEQRHTPKQYSISSFNASETREWISTLPTKNLPVPPLREISKHLDSQYNLITKHPYHDTHGNLIQYTLRLQEKDNPSKKLVLPLSFGRYHQSSHSQWSLKRFQFEKGKNPIYNAHLLKEHPSKQVIIVEGEKTADAGSSLFPHAITISWLGGSSSTKQVDWSPLFGREVIIWPDNDPAGFKAAAEISDCLKKIGVKSLHIVDSDMLSKEFPQKWDIADPLPPGKTTPFLNECLQRAEPKAISLDRLSALLECAGKNGKDPIEVLRLNEILWRVDARIRPELEKDSKFKPWDIENRILTEVSSVMNSREDLLKMASPLSGHKTTVESIVFQGMLYRAKTGNLPSQDLLIEIKNALVSCSSTINKLSQFDERAYGYALDKTCTMAIENRMQDKVRINESFQGYVRDVFAHQTMKAGEDKSLVEKKREISLPVMI